MKKFLILICLCGLLNSVKAQSPDLGFSYQAVVRDAQGNLLKNAVVELRFSLLPGSSTTSATWQEEHKINSDTFGICTVTIGTGKKVGGTVSSFDQVDFAGAEYWMEVEIKDNSGYVSLGKQKLLSVPYAKAAGNAQIFPSGMIMAFGGDTSKIPVGWLLCDGRAVSRSQFANLYNTIQDNWGRGDNATTFNLPDLRGRFLRGVDMGVGRDPDRNSRFSSNTGGNVGDNVGSAQDMELQKHAHALRTEWGQSSVNTATPGGYNQVSTGGYVTSGSFVQPAGGSETRPKNANVFYIIKF